MVLKLSSVVKVVLSVGDSFPCLAKSLIYVFKGGVSLFILGASGGSLLLYEGMSMRAKGKIQQVVGCCSLTIAVVCMA